MIFFEANLIRNFLKFLPIIKIEYGGTMAECIFSCIGEQDAVDRCGGDLSQVERTECAYNMPANAEEAFVAVSEAIGAKSEVDFAMLSIINGSGYENKGKIVQGVERCKLGPDNDVFEVQRNGSPVVRFVKVNHVLGKPDYKVEYASVELVEVPNPEANHATYPSFSDQSLSAYELREKYPHTVMEHRRVWHPIEMSALMCAHTGNVNPFLIGFFASADVLTKNAGLLCISEPSQACEQI